MHTSSNTGISISVRVFLLLKNPIISRRSDNLSVRKKELAELLLTLVMKCHQTISPFLTQPRLDSQEDEGPEITWSTATEAHAGDHESTKTEEPNAPQPGPADCEYHKDETQTGLHS